MALTEAVVSFVIERLGYLLINEAKFLCGVKDQVEDAKTKLLWMRAFLKDADAHVRDGDERVRLWVVQVSDNSYDLEDVIETYVFKVAYKKEGIISIGWNRGTELHKVGSKIEKISSKIATLTSNLQTYGIRELRAKELGETSSNNIQWQRELRRSYSHVVENLVVGFDKDIEELVTLLTSEENAHRHRVISVCGMGGVGKTTLARKVYKHPQVRCHFDYFAWASISQQCDPRDIWEEILIGLTSPTENQRKAIKSMRDSEITKELYKLQTQKKCLVLLDDIWTTSAWDRLKAAFPLGETHSKILLTTRVKNVVLHADQNGYIHEPQCLNENDSWELFQNRFSCFGRHPTDNGRMEVLGREMLRHCSGLPLAIIVLSGLLSTKHTVNEWEEMKRNVTKYITKGRDHGGLEYDGVSWVLGLSYDELPFYLKPYFLYLACYPEDTAIKVREVCHMLMAEGFISPRASSRETFEDVAYDCLSELVERSMIHVEKRSFNGRMKTFRIHDLMRDLCLSKAQDNNFLHFIELKNRLEEPVQYVSTDLRRVAIYVDNDRDDHFVHFVKNTNGRLRCLSVDTTREFYSTKQVLRQVFECFLMLRVLKLSFLSPNTLELPKEIGKLIHLRLFKVSGGKLEKIPSSIGNLKSLQTLKLDSAADMNMKVPNVMWKLEQLRHLCLPTPYGVELSRWLRLPYPSNLQTLTGVLTKYLDRNDFLHLVNLRKLKIDVERNLGRIYHHSSTAKFNCLQNLQVFSREYNIRVDIVPMILSYPEIYKLKLWLRIVNLPEDNQFSPNLIKIELRKCSLRDDPMPTLEKLPNLRVLFFYYGSFEGNEMVCSKGGFPQLESLQFKGLSALKEWKVEEGALSRLRFLWINHCPRLRRVPDGLRYMTMLQELKIQSMPRIFKERVKEGGEDFYKVEHVPSRVFL